MFTWIRRVLGIGMPCMFHVLTGLYCPGCGGTRAVRAMLRGNLRLSIQYHPLILYGMIVGLYEIISWIIAKRRQKPFDHFKKQRLFLMIGVGIVIVNWIYKNYMLIFQGVDLLPLF